MCFATCSRFRLPVTLWFPYPVFPGYHLLRLALNPLRGSHLPSPSLLRSSSGCRNLRLLSIRCAFRPHVRSRLTQGGRTFPGILGLSVCRILTCISLLTPAFSLPCCPYALSVILLPACNAPLPHILPHTSAASVPGLSPGTFSAQGHSTSELLRTLSRMAASEPTS